MKPRLLDLFCGAGGAAMGYHRAGFDVVGVDINPQPNYPFRFVQADALEVLRQYVDEGWFYDGSAWPIEEVRAIHSSPPCQAYSTTRTLHDVEYPRLIDDVRVLLAATGLPYVIENVVGAPLLSPIRLCGSSFGLGVWRHRLFETNWPTGLIHPCSHRQHEEPIDVTGTGNRRRGDRPDGGGGNSRKPCSIAEAREAMGIDWMTRRELNEAIPPAYTEFIGHQLLAHVQKAAA